MTSALVSAAVETPHVDYAALSPYIALAAGAMVVLLAGIFARRPAGPTALLSLVTLGVAAGLSIWRIGDPSDVLAGALRVDDFALVLSLAILGTGLGAVLLSWRARDATSGGHASAAARRKASEQLYMAAPSPTPQIRQRYNGKLPG